MLENKYLTTLKIHTSYLQPREIRLPTRDTNVCVVGGEGGKGERLRCSVIFLFMFVVWCFVNESILYNINVVA